MKPGVSIRDENPADASFDRPNRCPEHSGPSEHYTLEVSDLAFGWLPVVGIDVFSKPAAYPTVRSYMWGLDVTGTVHGGGGVGGLLLTTDGTNHQIPLYDANGNVQGLIDAGDGTLEAVYSYSAFGEPLGYANPTGGTYAQDNPIRFASRYCDEYTGLYQYNHRMYSPRLGRFITRDPIGEYGGLNLYAYCRNGPVDDWDYLGLMPDGGLGLVFPPADFVYFAGYVLSKIFSGSSDRPLLNEPTYRETWRAFERYTSSGGSLGRPMILRHSAKAEGVDVDEDQSDKVGFALSDQQKDAVAVFGGQFLELLDIATSLEERERERLKQELLLRGGYHGVYIATRGGHLIFVNGNTVTWYQNPRLLLALSDDPSKVPDVLRGP